MNLVVDASVGVKWFVDEDRTAQAREILAEALSAPDFLSIEIFNALSKRVRKGVLGPAALREVLPAVDRAIDDLVPSGSLLALAADLSIALDHPIYDCLYLALAKREGIPLVTADERQYAAARKARIAARLL